ncbi:MAG: sensor histidine kinase [Comamonas sp.]
MKRPLPRPWSSLAFRLALNYGVLLVLTVAIVLAVFYMQIVGVLLTRLDQQASLQLKRLQEYSYKHGVDGLREEIEFVLRDGVDSDTEILILMDADGTPIVGNARPQPARVLSGMGVRDIMVVRRGKLVEGRVAVARLPDGHLLAAGSDMQAQRDVEALFSRASTIVIAVALLMALGGALTFRRAVELRAGDIRNTMALVAAGDLRQRIPVQPGHHDEFTLLNRDINGMLDRLEHLMDGIRHVSNTIAHNLRTPLTRILLQLRAAEHQPPEAHAATLAAVTHEVAELGVVFDKLLGIAEVESGAAREAFGPVVLRTLLEDLCELYEPLVQEQDGSIVLQVQGEPTAWGDANLLASALANVLENAIKYGAGTDGRLQLELQASLLPEQALPEGMPPGSVQLLLRDHGPGVAAEDLPQLATRFYRAERSRQGYGLGLASVLAVVRLHGGQLLFEPVAPGLAVRIVLPAIPEAAGAVQQAAGMMQPHV